MADPYEGFDELREQMNIEGYQVYISGPMSGQPLHGLANLYDAHRTLVDIGFSCRTPGITINQRPAVLALLREAGAVSDSHFDEVVRWDTCLGRDLAQGVIGAEAIILLPGWEDSMGCTLEALVAVELNTTAFLYDDVIVGEPRVLAPKYVRQVFMERRA